MKKNIAAFVSFFLFSCMATKTIPIKGSYPAPPIVTISDRPFEKVWDNVIDYFAQNGIPIKIIDKSSGLIVSDKAKLSWSFEDKNGQIFSKTAFVVLDKIIDKMSGKPFVPESVTGEWNLRIKTDGGRTLINVNLFNIQATYGKYYYSSYSHTVIEPVNIEGRTTGVFEHKFEDMVK